MGNIDDQYRNPNTNNKDHLVGQLTIVKLGNFIRHMIGKLGEFIQKIVSLGKLIRNIRKAGCETSNKRGPHIIFIGRLG